jgi:anthranilate synthase component 1
VHVDELMIVEEYSHVFHLVSQVSAELRDDISAFEALNASFPNGTVSGAPKIRAMQIINELEPCSRQFYAGSLGMFDFAGQLRSTILIRTIHVAKGVASTQASAGIVYDSVPELEWQETRNKMAACLVAMQRTR